MKEKYLALEAVEFGVIMNEEHLFTSLEQAEEEFNDFFDGNGYGSGIIFKIEEDRITIHKSKFNL